jgi:hypothetical protein
MSDQVQDKNPEAQGIPTSAASLQKPASASDVVSEERRGGPVGFSSLPETVEHLILDNPRGLASDASTRLLLGWLRQMDFRQTRADLQVEHLTSELAAAREKLAAEEKARAIAEQRLASLVGHRPLREVCLVGGVAMFGFSVEHWSLGAPAYLMATVGIVVLAVAIVRRGKE